MHDSSAVDYEVEYNNRARVPEWPEHFARWARRPPPIGSRPLPAGVSLGLPYGRSPRETIDLFFAEEREHRRWRCLSTAACSDRWSLPRSVSSRAA